jgi:serine/threonine-protein kinase PknK
MLANGALLAGRYRVEGLLGTGGFGHTYRVTDLAQGAVVALKLLHDLPSRESFRAEFARLAELSHPHLVRVRDYGRANIAGQLAPFFTCDLIAGESLRAYCTSHGFAACEQALRDAISALAFLHRLDLRHGDLKPENVLVDSAGRGTLIDLGCTAPHGARMISGGTPAYLAPELARGEPGDARADLYALGLTLRELGAQGSFAALAERVTRSDVRARPSSLASACAEAGLELSSEHMSLGRSAPLLGREEKRAQAAAALERVAEGRAGPRIVWVQGARGVGTTRFLRALCFAADERFALYEQYAEREALRALLGRALRAPAPGVEALVHSIATLSAEATPTLLVVHDLDRATTEAEAEWRLALSSGLARGNLCWLVSSTRAPPPGVMESGCLHLTLRPLGLSELAEWAAPLVPTSKLAGLHAYTGGFPLQIERTLSALVAGTLRIDALESGGTRMGEEEAALAPLLSDLGSEERTLLACLALGLDAASVPSARLLERGLVRHDHAGLSLARSGDAAVLLRILPDRLVQPLCLRAAERARSESSLDALGRRIAYLARAGREDDALQVLRGEAERATHDPRAIAMRASPLSAYMTAPDLTLLASLFRQSGEPQTALSLLARARRKAASAVEDALRVEAAECYLALGQLQRAEHSLSRVRAKDAALALECALRVCIRKGDYAGVRRLFDAARPEQPSAALRARLHESLALACSYLGEHGEAERLLDEAERSETEAAPRSSARRSSLRGFLSMRRGDPERALAAYEKTLALADAGGLSDLVANALSNLASARHMLGSYGSARNLYERARAMARALGRRQSELYLRVNLANLALESGALDEAEKRLDAIAEETLARSLPVERALFRYRAELCLLRGDPSGALAALATLTGNLDGREQRECLLLRAEAELNLQENERAESTLTHPALHEAEPDLEARVALLLARLAFARARDKDALLSLDRALAAAKKSGLLPLLARVEADLALSYQEAGSPTLAREHARHARAAWERMALDLKSAERDAFFAHPQRARLHALEPAPRAPRESSLSFARVIELSRRINAQRTIEDVLDFALDAAIELSSAERGFVLLYDASEGTFAVKSARAVDKHPLDGAALAFSRGIAERVIQSGEAVITLDAAADVRFAGQASVHAMGLKSVLCVPVIGARDLRGALYLDNRYLRSRFSGADAELVQAFSEQVAVALSNAQLFLELEQKQRELLRKQRKVEELLAEKGREVERLEVALVEAREARARFAYREIVGDSSSLRRVFATLDRVIPTDLPVIVLGESGTGKELVARALHAEGPRAQKAFVSINCGALPEPLLESELFGYVKGAFTGADRDKVGLFVTAHGGTLFLDELGELPLSLQVKLLRVLTERAVRPVGATRSLQVDVRIVAATNRNLKRMVEAGSFREDLYYRLNVVELTLPPLRERREDIIPIAERVLERRARERKSKAKRLSSGAAQRLLTHPFPGNVRELENVLVRAEALCEGDIIRASDLGLTREGAPLGKQQPRSRAEFAHQEAELLLETLERERWNVSNVSRNLGIPRNTLYRKLTRLGLSPKQGREPKRKKR